MSLHNTHLLKRLKSQLAKLEADAVALREETRRKQQEESAVANKIAALKDEINKLSQESEIPIITEHALLRYIERAKNISLEEVKQEMLPLDVIHQINTLRSGKFPIMGCRLIVKDRTVVTVEPN